MGVTSVAPTRQGGRGHARVAAEPVAGLGPPILDYIGLPTVQGTLCEQPAAHQQPAALICAAVIWKAWSTSSRSIGVIVGRSYRGRLSTWPVSTLSLLTRTNS